MSPSSPKAHKLGVSGTTALPDELFGQHFHGSLVHEVVRAELAANRQGTAATKTRGAVHGGGKKPWRQKGTGRARIGSIRAPHWTGGGTAFGPSPRHYTFKVNRKARRKALRSALSLHGEHGTVAVVSTDAFSEPSTKKAVDLLKSWGADGTTLVVLTVAEIDCAKSFRNLVNVRICDASDLAVADLVWAANVIFSESALEIVSRVAAEKPSHKAEVRAA